MHGNTKYTVWEMGAFGIFFKEKYWNKRYATEALKRTIECAFVENNVYIIHTGCFKENTGSERVMQKCGFTKEAEFKEYILHEGKIKDRIEYRLFKEEYNAEK